MGLEVIVESEVRDLDRLQAVEVGVREGRSACVLLDQREGGTGNVETGIAASPASRTPQGSSTFTMPVRACDGMNSFAFAEKYSSIVAW